MKTFLFCLGLIVCLIGSCTKSPDNIQQTNVTPSKVFVPVTLIGGPGYWGGGVCSYGYTIIREDSSSLVYQTMVLPAYANITYTPVSVKIQYHDTIWAINTCRPKIVVDSIKF